MKERRESLQFLLKEGFEVQEGSKVSVQSDLAYLGCDYDSQKLVSHVIKGTFPLVEIRREDKSGTKCHCLKF